MAWDSSTVLVAALSVGYVALAWLGYRFLLPRRPAGRRLALVHPAPATKATTEPKTEVKAEPAARRPADLRPRYGVRQTIWHYRWAIAVLSAGLPIAMWFAFWLASERLALDAVPDAVFDPDIDWHLRGVKLVPPPPLPPEAFVTIDRPFLAGADRDWGKLQPTFRDKVLAAMKAAEQRGYRFALLEGYRSPGRQDFLAGQGAHVTMATAFQSKHQFGLAADLSPVRDGVLVIRESDPWALAAYLVLGEEARSRGLTWGGDWTIRDYGHVEQR